MEELTLSQIASQMGKKGGAVVKEKYGTNHFSKMGKLGMKKRWGKGKNGKRKLSTDTPLTK